MTTPQTQYSCPRTGTWLPVSAEQFFYENAGFSWNPQTETQDEGKRRCAAVLAKAEADGRKAGLTFKWVEDENCGPDDFEFAEDKAHVIADGARGCIVFRDCPHCHQHTQMPVSLWGITESLDNRERNNYRRVVEAELAMEALDVIEKEAAK